MSKKNTKTMKSGMTMGLARAALFLTCGTLAFALGIRMTDDVEPVASSIAQAAQDAHVNVILQYQPVDRNASALPIEITPFMNGTQNALIQFHDVHTNAVEPGPIDRCKTTNAAGRCEVSSLPVGPNPSADNEDRQYDIVVDTVFIETLTNIPIQEQLAFVRFDPGKCSGSTTSFAGDTWCLTKSGANFAPEYFVTITLNERDVCTQVTPPAPFCSGDDISTFICNPQFGGPTNPWEDVTNTCDFVECPDGNTVTGKCDGGVSGLANCSTAAACANNQICSVQNFNSSVRYEAGTDTIVIAGKRFGTQGGTVSFPREGGSREVVQISAGPNWTDTQISVLVPQSAISGTLEIHPNTHGFLTGQSGLTPVTCESPTASIRSFADQFVILGITAVSPRGISLVAAGFETKFTLLARHNTAASQFDEIFVELVEGTFTDPGNLPISRTLVAQRSCPVNIVGNALAQEATLTCTVPIPQSASQYSGPFTYIVTLVDKTGGSVTTVLLAAGNSVLIGDFSQDGSLSIADVVIAYRIANGTSVATNDQLLRDSNGDGAITMDDVLFVLHALTQS